MTKEIEKDLFNFAKNESCQFKKPLILRRHLVVLFACTGAFIMFLVRYNLSVAIVSIVDEKITVTNINNTNDFIQKPKYDLADSEVSQILASYFYGYTIFQLPAGRFSELYGARKMLGLGVFISSILSFFVPFMFDLHFIAACVVRFFVGALHCTVLSCSYTLFAEWLPNNQKAAAITMMNVGFEIGGMLSFFSTGFICTNLHWKWSFYLFSLTAIVWVVFFYFMCYSNPDQDPYLSDYERNLIEKERIEEYSKEDFSKSKLIKIPPKLNLKRLITSKPVNASLFAKMAVGFGYYIVTIKMPGYLHDIFSMPIKETGSYTSLAEGCCFAVKLLCIGLATLLTKVNSISLTNQRKIFQSFAMLIPAICFYAMIIKNDSQVLDIFFLCTSMAAMGFVCLGDTAITSEFGKDLSGTIFGYTNSFACAMGVLCPVISGFILEKYPNDKTYAWNVVFGISGTMYLICFVIFALFATAEVQDWAVSRFVTAEEIKEKKMNKKNEQYNKKF